MNSPEHPAPSEIDVGAAKPQPNAMRKVVVLALAVIVILFTYHVLADRFTPYTS